MNTPLDYRVDQVFELNGWGSGLLSEILEVATQHDSVGHMLESEVSQLMELDYFNIERISLLIYYLNDYASIDLLLDRYEQIGEVLDEFYSNYSDHELINMPEWNIFIEYSYHRYRDVLYEGYPVTDYLISLSDGYLRNHSIPQNLSPLQVIDYIVSFMGIVKLEHYDNRELIERSDAILDRIRDINTPNRHVSNVIKFNYNLIDYSESLVEEYQEPEYTFEEEDDDDEYQESEYTSDDEDDDDNYYMNLLKGG